MFNFYKTIELENEINFLKERIEALENKEDPQYGFDTGEKTYVTRHGHYVMGGFPKYEYIALTKVIDMILAHLKLEIKYNKASESSVEIAKKKP
jgi:hypothetical protein